MPIYAYKCESCGHSKDVLQKMSDAPLTDCPQCGAVAFKKQLTAAGFQLKGSGWYVTDFRDNKTDSKAGSDASKESAGSAKTAVAASGSSDKPSKSEAAAPAPASTSTSTQAASPSSSPTPKAAT
jgi:putative FmdB family regulatory protein